MAEKLLNTRIQLKYDSYANWSSKNPVLRQGEVAIAYLAESHTQLEGKDQHPVMFKVGPGNFNDLPWASALAADVHAWAKKSENDFKTWVKGIIEVTDINAYSKEEVDTFFTNYNAALKKYADDAVAAEALLARAAEKENKDAIAVLNGEGEGSVKKAVADAKSDLEGQIGEVNTAVTNAQAAIDAIEEDYLKGADKTELEGKITAEETRATGIEAGLRTDVDAIKGDYLTSTDRTNLEGAIEEVAEDVADIVADYLKDADKTELEGKITAEAERADAAEKANAAAIKAIKDDYLTSTDRTNLQGSIDAQEDRIDTIVADYLKAADKTELKNEIDVERKRIDTIVADYLVEDDIKDFATQDEVSNAVAAEESRATKAEENLQTQINTIMNNPDTEGVINSINEFTAYIEEHGEIADGFRTDIDANAEAIGEEATARANADALLQGQIDALKAIDHEAYIAADTALKNELNGEIAKKADKTALEEAIAGVNSTITNKEAALDGRLKDVEALLTGGEGSVGEQIEDAKEAAIEAAAADATTKADAAQAAAIAAAKEETTTQVTNAIAEAAADAAEKDVVILAEAQAYADKAEEDAVTAANANTAEVIKNYYTKSEADAAFMDSTEVSNAIAGQISALDLPNTYDTKGAAAAAETAAKAYADGLAGNYATAAQGAKADSALQEITASTGLVVNNKNEVAFDDNVVFVFNCGNASTLVD